MYRQKTVTVWKRGRLNTLHWAIKATRQKVKDKPFCTRRVVKKKRKDTHIAIKHITEPPKYPTGSHIKTHFIAAAQDKKKSHTS